MKLKVHRPVYGAQGEPLIEAWCRWGSFATPPGLNGHPWFMRGGHSRLFRYGGHLRLPGRYMLVMVGGAG